MVSYLLSLLVLADWPLARRSPAVAIADSLAGQVSGTPRYLGLQYNPAPVVVRSSRVRRRPELLLVFFANE